MNNYAIDSSLYLTKQQERKTGDGSLGQDAFMKILIAQLQNQDPLNPMEDRDFIAQMASFSSLEQMMNMTKMFETFIANQTNTQIVQNSQMIGKQVTYMNYIEQENGEVNEVRKTGTVVAISFKGGDMLFELENGEKVEPQHIFEIRQMNDLTEG